MKKVYSLLILCSVLHSFSGHAHWDNAEAYAIRSNTENEIKLSPPRSNGESQFTKRLLSQNAKLTVLESTGEFSLTFETRNGREALKGSFIDITSPGSAAKLYASIIRRPEQGEEFFITYAPSNGFLNVGSFDINNTNQANAFASTIFEVVQ